MQWQAVLQASGPEATLVKRRSGARFDVDGRSSRSKTAPGAAGLCDCGDAVDEILGLLVDRHQVLEQTQYYNFFISYLNRHVHADTSTRSRHSVISDSSAAVRAVHLDQLRRARIPLLGSSCLELAIQDSARLCHSVNF